MERERRRVERWAAQGVLYAGLYDGGGGDAPARSRFVLLNGMCADDDPASRRFAMLEID